ncbi:LexA family transcriptional regulator [Pseudomonas sp. Rh2]|uniref:Helix-turn-helix domain-containing protein n=3 Tax=Pseudomonas TaxID=286 RepID=A0ABR6V3N4_9PSED|nr:MULTISPECIES: LexA family transcriptional regulator [Pseudomonas]MBC3475043.1 helix-turn-helix domain-containing protein [Pseudomonas taiwanensis]MBC3490345.1 helix-turn-helix domain-containing protein [Pseudomonas taiwanensis]MDT8923296.1 LexA family transcriptional regulator [Pseudomonas taiwanensis]MPS99569.1 helix-turn-helix domain-containing protein [Pseudomonas sp.]
MFIERSKAVRIVPAMNMDKWIALVRERMEELDISQEQLAERVGVSQGSVGHWLCKRRQPRVDSMNRVFVELGMPHYHVSMQLRVLGRVGEDPGSYTLDEVDDDQDLMQYIVCFRYPVLGWEQVGSSTAESSTVFEQTDYLAQGNAFWLPVENDAMSTNTGRSVPQGMRVLVDPGLEAVPGKLVIARLPGKSAILRELAEEGGQRYLKALNNSYPALLCEEGCEFLGVVVQAHGVF